MSKADLLYLSREDVIKTNLSMHDIIMGLENMFVEKSRGQTEMPPKPGVHPHPDCFIHAMPGYIPAMNACGIKWVSGYPTNQAQGLPYISGLLILNNPNTGVPIAVMDATWITAQRTAAASALSAKYLANAEAKELAIIGCGVQGLSHIEAFCTQFAIGTVHAFDIDNSRASFFKKSIEDQYNIKVKLHDSSESAIRSSQLIVTSGPILKEPRPALQPDWLNPGCFMSAVDFDSYLTPLAQKEFDIIITDDKDQLNYYRTQGYFKHTPEINLEIGDVILNTRFRRTHAKQKTLCMNLGIALDDMATAIQIYNKAKQLNIGTKLAL